MVNIKETIIKIRGMQEQAQINDDVRKIISNKTILITGGAGNIGSHLVLSLLKNFDIKKLIIIDFNEQAIMNLQSLLFSSKLNLTTPISKCEYHLGMVAHHFDKLDGVDIVFNCAAYKDPRGCETQIDKALENNYLAVKALLVNCKLKGVSHFIQCSTDKAVMPSSIMGMTKRFTEKHLENINYPNYKYVRFGNILETPHSIFEVAASKAESQQTFTINGTMSRFFITKDEAVAFLINSLSSDKIRNVYQMGNIVDCYKAIKTMFPDLVINIGKPVEGDKMIEELYYEWED